MSNLKGRVDKLERQIVPVTPAATILFNIVNAECVGSIKIAWIPGNEHLYRRDDESEEAFLERVDLTEQQNTDCKEPTP